MKSVYRTVSAALITAMAFGAMAQGVIKSVEIKPLTQGMEVIVLGEKLEKPRDLRLLNGQSFIAEFDASLDVRGFRRRVDRGGVTSVEVGWFSAKPPKARIHFKLEPSLKPIISEIEGGWTIKVGPGVVAEPGTVVPPTKPTGKADDFPAKTPPLKAAVLPPVKTAPQETKIEGSSQIKTDLKSENKAANALKPDETQAKPLPRLSNVPQPKPSAGISASIQPSAEKRVNLEFVGADVIMILRALSQEAGVNIVTAPDISPSDRPSRLTVSLKGETVTNALNYVTVMAGLRYAKLGNTFFVTKAENFATTMRSFFRGDAAKFDTRVVNLISGEAGQIRQAVFASHSQEGSAGFYDILDPAGAGPPWPQVQKKSSPSGRLRLLLALRFSLCSQPICLLLSR